MKNKYLFLIGNYYPLIFKHIDISNIYVALPINEKAFPKETQSEYFEKIGKNINLISYDEKEIMEIIKIHKPDTLITIGWRRIISNETIKSFNKCINIHPAILPYYRGYHTEPYVIMNNENKHGITAHFLTNIVDDGKIILQKCFSINEFSTVASIKKGVSDIMPNFIKELLYILDSDNIKEINNDKSKIKVIAPKRKPKDSEIDPSLSLLKLYHVIRSCDPEKYPAFFYFNNEKINIKIWRESKKKNNIDEL
ncbi:MAG: formyltransferase family protein [Ignavibacteriae bacterium]|nr:formyltransferase family protein [Ignavibacteriota bacterium]